LFLPAVTIFVTVAFVRCLSLKTAWPGGNSGERLSYQADSRKAASRCGAADLRAALKETEVAGIKWQLSPTAPVARGGPAMPEVDTGCVPG
jgi:hypothetical protein